jgi:hypothetical protein
VWQDQGESQEEEKTVMEWAEDDLLVIPEVHPLPPGLLRECWLFTFHIQQWFSDPLLLQFF